MLEAAPEETWLELEKLLPKNYGRDDPNRCLPVTLSYQGCIEGQFSVIPSDEFLHRLRSWLLKRNETKVLYFLIEAANGDQLNSWVNLDQLNRSTLEKVNSFGENIIAAQDYSWSLFIDQDGNVYVAGPNDLFEALQD